MFDSRQYEWADVTVIVGGADITGIRGLKVATKREFQTVYAKGKEPHSMQSGNSSYEGELEMLQSSFSALEDAAGGSIHDASVDILVSFGNPSNGDAIRTKKISGVRFPSAEIAVKQGDTFIAVTLPFIALGIKNII
jgi:hypothetical protein